MLRNGTCRLLALAACGAWGAVLATIGDAL